MSQRRSLFTPYRSCLTGFDRFSHFPFQETWLKLRTSQRVIFVSVPKFFNFLVNLFQHQRGGGLLIIDLDVVRFQHNLHVAATILKQRLPALTDNSIHGDVITCQTQMTSSKTQVMCHLADFTNIICKVKIKVKYTRVWRVYNIW